MIKQKNKKKDGHNFPVPASIRESNCLMTVYCQGQIPTELIQNTSYV